MATRQHRNDGLRLAARRVVAGPPGPSPDTLGIPGDASAPQFLGLKYLAISRRLLLRLLALGLCAAVLLAVGEAAPGWFPVQVQIDGQEGTLTVTIDGERHTIGRPAGFRWESVRLVSAGPLDRDTQIDGSDRKSRSNAIIQRLQATPVYQWDAWLADEPSYSRWKYGRIVDLDTNLVLTEGASTGNVQRLPTTFHIDAALERPEGPARLVFGVANRQFTEALVVNPGERSVAWVRTPDDGGTQPSWYRSSDAGSAIGSILKLLGRVVAAGYGLALAGLLIAAVLAPLATRMGSVPLRFVGGGSWRVVAAAMLLGFFCATAWLTITIFHQLPHVVDAVAYYFQAGVFASGKLFLEVPPNATDFNSMEEVIRNGRWFAQYPPGAPAAYAMGRLLNLAWLVGPLALTLFLGGTAAAAYYWYGPRLALLTLAGGVISPFVLFQAGTFMSHPIVGGVLGVALALFAFGERRRQWWPFALVGFLAGYGFLGREIDTLLFVLPLLGWLLIHRRWRPLLAVCFAALPFGLLYLAYNLRITGDPFVIPRALLGSVDRPGFGLVGPDNQLFTPADGLVIVVRDLTNLQFALFGWPPLFALGLLVLPFLLGDAAPRDWLAACGVLLFVGAYAAYFFDGMGNFGPRYYFLAVPYLLLLAARGVQSVTRVAIRLGLDAGAARAGALAPVALLTLNTLFIYLPAVVERDRDWAAVAHDKQMSFPFVETTLAGPRVRGVQTPALVLVPDGDVFKTLVALNCPDMSVAEIGKCPVLFAGVNDSAGVKRQRAAFPGRHVYQALLKQGTVILQPD